MKKKVLGMMLGMAVVLTGCAGSTKVIEKDTAAAGGESGAQQEAAAETADADGDGEEKTQEAAAAEHKGYVFVYNDVTIEMDAEAAPIVEALGEPASYFEAPSCAFEGIDKVYTYGSFELDTYPIEGTDYVSSVVIKDDMVSTPEGICIGSSRQDMEGAYGTEWSDEEGMIVYEKDGMKLCFILEGNAIASIEFRSTAADQ